MNFLAIGHSHLTALEQAWTLQCEGRPDIEMTFLQLWGRYEPFRTADGFNRDLIADLTALIESVRPDGIVASLVGSENFQVAFNSPDRPFDFLSPGQMEVGPGLELVPHALVRMKMREIAGYIDLVHTLAELSGAPVFYPLPPPPLGDLTAQRAMLEPTIKRAFEGLPLPSRSLQKRLWDEMCDGIRDVCASGPRPGRVTVLPPPPAALDGEGLLIIDRARDYVHADRDYGGMVLEQIFSAMNGTQHATPV